MMSWDFLISLISHGSPLKKNTCSRLVHLNNEFVFLFLKDL